mmetsp:Transcript_31464/g.58694  ORF Transcript_31464/g.58694 Transcript_31464/m.58694 type:complete len:379 (-) Transcript_31464:93-1229(-)
MVEMRGKLAAISFAVLWGSAMGGAATMTRGMEDSGFAALATAATCRNPVNAVSWVMSNSKGKSLREITGLYDTLIQACIAYDNLLVADYWLRRTEEAGLKCNKQTYKRLATACIDYDNLMVADYWLKRTEEVGIRCDAETSKRLAVALSLDGQHDKAKWWAEKHLHQSGDLEFHSMILDRAMKAAQQAKKAAAAKGSGAASRSPSPGDRSMSPFRRLEASMHASAHQLRETLLHYPILAKAVKPIGTFGAWLVAKTLLEKLSRRDGSARGSGDLSFATGAELQMAGTSGLSGAAMTSEVDARIRETVRKLERKMSGQDKPVNGGNNNKDDSSGEFGRELQRSFQERTNKFQRALQDEMGVVGDRFKGELQHLRNLGRF